MTARLFNWDGYTPDNDDVSIQELSDWMYDNEEFAVEAMIRIQRWWREYGGFSRPLIKFITQDMYACALNQAQACGHRGVKGPAGPSFPDVFGKILNLGRVSMDIEQWTASEVICKLFEEGGELAQAVLIETGKMPHKKLDSPDEVYDEVADVMICALDALAKVYGGTLTDEQIANKVINSLYKKMNKWDVKVLLPQSQSLKKRNLELA